MKLSNRFTVLAFGIISLSALAASPAAAQNASSCRSAIGVAGDFAERCMVKPEGNLSTAILGAVDAAHSAQDAANIDIHEQAADWESYALRDAQGNLVVKVYKDG